MKAFPLSLLSLALVLGACSAEQPARNFKVASTTSSDDSKESQSTKKGSTQEDKDIGSDEESKGSDKGDRGKEDENSSDGEKETTPKTEEPTQETPTKETPKTEEPTKETPKDEPAVDTSCYKGDAFICEIERIIDEETNKLRASAGKPALKHVKEISFVSRDWSQQQANRGSIGHEGFPDQRKQVWKAEFQSNASFWAENAAMMSSGSGDASSIAKKFVDMWWNSPGHKANMLSGNTNIGSGVAKKGNSYYATQLFNK